MKIGVCAGADILPIAQAAHCDYVEMNFSTVASMEEAAYQELKAAVNASSLRVEAMNCFLPGTMRLTGPKADHAAPIPFMEKGFTRAKALGVQVVVFGSGGARAIPEGFSLEEAKVQFASFARLAVGYAQQQGIKLVIEPLGHKECNFIHTVKEALEIRRLAGEPDGLFVLADLFHMHQNDEDFDGILEAGTKLAHCHIAAPVSRVFCQEGQADAYFQAFFAALKGIGYAGRISLEGTCPDPAADLAPSVAYLKTLVK